MILLAALLLPASLAAAADPVETFLSRVVVEPGVPASQADQLRAALKTAAGTPTGRERAERLAAGGWSVRIGTAAFGLTIEREAGVDVPIGKAGNTDATVSPPLVRVDSVLLSGAPDVVPDTLAHEVFGHALSALEAKKAGVYDAWTSSAEDEMLAELVGSLVSRERGRPFHSDDSGARLIQSTASYVRLHWFGSAGQPGTISAEDASAPAEALRARLSAQTEEAARLDGVLDQIHEWQLQFMHFGTVHEISPERFESLWQYLEESRLTNNAARADLDRARGAVYDKMVYLTLPEGLKLRRALASKSYARFAGQRRSELDRLRARLIALGAGEPAPAPAGVATFTDDRWEQLRKMVVRDLKDNPDHWR